VKNIEQFLNFISSQEVEYIKISPDIKLLVKEIVGENPVFKEEMKRGYILKKHLMNRILLNEEYSFQLGEQHWKTQFETLQTNLFILESMLKEELESFRENKKNLSKIIETNKQHTSLIKLKSHLLDKMKNSEDKYHQLIYLLG